MDTKAHCVRANMLAREIHEDYEYRVRRLFVIGDLSRPRIEIMRRRLERVRAQTWGPWRHRR